MISEGTIRFSFRTLSNEVALSHFPHTNEFYMFATAIGVGHRESYMHHNHTEKDV